MSTISHQQVGWFLGWGRGKTGLLKSICCEAERMFIHWASQTKAHHNSLWKVQKGEEADGLPEKRIWIASAHVSSKQQTKHTPKLPQTNLGCDLTALNDCHLYGVKSWTLRTEMPYAQQVKALKRLNRVQQFQLPDPKHYLNIGWK